MDKKEQKEEEEEPLSFVLSVQYIQCSGRHTHQTTMLFISSYVVSLACIVRETKGKEELAERTKKNRNRNKIHGNNSTI